MFPSRYLILTSISVSLFHESRFSPSLTMLPIHPLSIQETPQSSFFLIYCLPKSCFTAPSTKHSPTVAAKYRIQLKTKHILLRLPVCERGGRTKLCACLRFMGKLWQEQSVLHPSQTVVSVPLSVGYESERMWKVNLSG